MNWNERFVELGKELLERGYLIRRQDEVISLERRVAELEVENRELRARVAGYDRMSGEIMRAIAKRLPGDEISASTAGATNYTMVDGGPVQRGANVERRWMTISDYAITRGYSKRQIQQWIVDGLPCIGERKARRIVVAEADAWIARAGQGRAAGG